MAGLEIASLRQWPSISIDKRGTRSHRQRWRLDFLRTFRANDFGKRQRHAETTFRDSRVPCDSADLTAGVSSEGSVMEYCSFPRHPPGAFDDWSSGANSGHLYGHLRIPRELDVNNAGGVPAHRPVCGRFIFELTDFHARLHARRIARPRRSIAASRTDVEDGSYVSR